MASVVDFFKLFFKRPIPLIILQLLMVFWAVGSIITKVKVYASLQSFPPIVVVIEVWSWIGRLLFDFGSLYVVVYRKKHAYLVAAVWVVFVLALVLTLSMNNTGKNPTEMAIQDLIRMVVGSLVIIWGIWFFFSKKVRNFFAH